MSTLTASPENTAAVVKVIYTAPTGKRTTGRIHRSTCKHMAQGAERMSPAQAGVDALMAASRATCCSVREFDRRNAVAEARSATEAAEAQAAAAAAADAAAAEIPSGERHTPALRSGGLRDLVAVHLSASPDASFTPYQVGRALHRSNGAVAKALAKLAALGTAELVSAAPLTYRAAS